MTPFTSSRAQSVAAHGERRLIAGIRAWLGQASPVAPFGIGDDCAVIPPTRQHQLVTTDPVIWGQHFDAKVSACKKWKDGIEADRQILLGMQTKDEKGRERANPRQCRHECGRRSGGPR